jgi:hypothetical protein
MQQLSIEYFFPLTEQLSLELDYKPCADYDESKRKESVYTGYKLNSWNAGTTWATISNNIDNRSFTIHVDQCPIIIVSKKKPNFIKQSIYKSLGIKWKIE